MTDFNRDIWYEIDVNVARKGHKPSWHELQDANGDCIKWSNEADARSALADEGRGNNARVLRCVGGICKPIAP
jgi:hypothetical protein